MMGLLEKIKRLSEEYSEQVIESRRHLHANPELSYQEYNTAKFVAGQLRSFGVNVVEGIATTGLLAEIRGKNPEKKSIALRADMDALPISEANDVPYRSQVPGVMHACGHDVHTASLLGTARILNSVKDQFEGTVRLLFQPGEEKKSRWRFIHDPRWRAQQPAAVGYHWPACISTAPRWQGRFPRGHVHGEL